MGPSGDVVNMQKTIGQKQLDLAGDQNKRWDQLWNMVLPGFQKSKDFYSDVASGDPNVISRVMAPATQQITAAGTQAKQNIDQTMPRGGEKNLAKELVDVNSAGQVGRNATQSYLSAFPALMSVFSSGSGLGSDLLGKVMAGLQGGAQTYGQVGQEQAQGKQAMMSMLGGLAGAGGEIGAAAV